MSFKKLAPLLLLTLSCSKASKCEETFSCVEQRQGSSPGRLDGGSDIDLQDGGGFGDASGGTQGGGSGAGGSTGLTAGNGGTNGSGGNTGNGGEDGNGGDGGSVVLCGSTRGTGCTPSQQDAVFVDAAAPEGGDGSLTSPLSSIVAALELAKDADATDIYICPGNYDESVLITDNEAGIDLHGGFRCEGFTYDATAIPVIEPSNGDYALHIDALTSAILLDISLSAP
jgi:hypothetical protein